jgi:hypothetical protein
MGEYMKSSLLYGRVGVTLLAVPRQKGVLTPRVPDSVEASPVEEDARAELGVLTSV